MMDKQIKAVVARIKNDRQALIRKIKFSGNLEWGLKRCFGR
jgi:hypothetical protein